MATQELIAASEWRAIDFISDLHLQTSEPATFNVWQHYMQTTPASAVFILGDLFEVWVGDDLLQERGFEFQCAQVIKKTAARLPTFFMHGNRDFLVGQALMDLCHATLLDDPTVLTFSGQRWLLWANGPALGPALLIWPALIFGLLIAVLLARSGVSALGFSSWALLLLALFNLHSSAALVVVAWFVLLQWRMRSPKLSNRAHWLSQTALVALSAIAVLCIIAAALKGLLAPVDMQVSGYGSSERLLRWSADQSAGALPSAAAFGIPMWWYKAMTLVWALWLAWALVGWLRYGKRALSQGGFWRPGLWSGIKRKFASKPSALVPPLPPRAVDAAAIGESNSSHS